MLFVEEHLFSIQKVTNGLTINNSPALINPAVSGEYFCLRKGNKKQEQEIKFYERRLTNIQIQQISITFYVQLN